MPAKKKITKERILHTALSMLEKNGYDTVNVKSLAAKLDCSTQPIYLSYRNMAELRQALCEAAVQKFTDAIGQDGCLYGMEYIRFAKENRNLFRLQNRRRMIRKLHNRIRNCPCRLKKWICLCAATTACAVPVSIQ